MNNLKKVSLATTIIDVLMCILGGIGIIVSIVYIHMIDDGFAAVSSFMNRINPDSVTAGYEVIGGLFGYLGTGIFGLLMGILLVMSMGLFVLTFIPSISGLICLSRYKKVFNIKEMFKPVRVDSIIKIISNGLLCVIIVFSAMDSRSFDLSALTALILPMAAAGLSIYQICEVNNLSHYLENRQVENSR